MFSSKLKIAPILALSLVPALTGCLSNVGGDQPQDTGPSFFVSSLHGDVSNTASDSWNFPKERLINFKVCLKDQVSLRDPVYQPFAVSDGTSEKTYTTDGDGCFNWTEKHDFDYLSGETFLTLPRKIRALGADSGTFDLNIAYNPWHEGPSGVLDLRYDVPPKLQAPAPNRTFGFAARIEATDTREALLDVSSINLDFQGLDYAKYRVDPLLSLSVAHSYRLRFNPTIYRQGIGGDLIPEAPKQGKLRVTIVLVPEGLRTAPEPKDILAQTQVEVEIVKGLAWKDISLQFRDLASIMNRMQALVEVQPIDDSRMLAPLRLQGPIGPMPAVTNVSLVPSELSAVAAYRAHEDQQNAIAASPALTAAQALTRYAGLQEVKLADLTADGSAATLSRAEAQTLLDSQATPESRQAALRKVCQMAYGAPGAPAPARAPGLGGWLSRLNGNGTRRSPGESALDFCLRTPDSALKLVRRELVEKLDSPTPKLELPRAEIETLDVSASISRSKTDSNASGTRKGFSAEAGIGLNAGWNPLSFLKMFGITIGFGAKGEWYHTLANDRSSGNARSVTASRRLSLVAEFRTFELSVTARPCSLVGPNLDLDDLKDDQKFAGYFVCGEKAESKKASETYYLINPTPEGSSPFSDPNSASENPYRIFIRGKSAYSVFKKLMTDPGAEIMLDATPIESETWVLKQLNPRLTQDFPGMLSE